MSRQRTVRGAVVAAAAVLGALLMLVSTASADCTEVFAAPKVLESFSSATDFANGLDDLGGTLAGSSTMALFQRDASAGFLTLKPASATSAWSVGVPVSQQASVPLTEAVGSVVAFDLGATDPSQFTVSVLTRLATSPTSATPIRRELPVQPYVPSASGGTFVSVRVPVQHFLLPINQVLVGIEFRAFAGPYGTGATAVRFDNVRVEFNRCPHRRNVVPLQTCNPNAASILVDDFSDATRFAAGLNVLGGLWSDDLTMASMQRLTAGNIGGPGLLLNATDFTSYWYTLLKTGTLGCVNPWPYTTLRLEVAASVGLQFDIGLSRLADDCVSNSTINEIRVQSSAFTSFAGLTQTRTLDIPLGLLPRNPIKAIALSGFYRPPGAPTDGTLKVVVRSISFLRDCARLATEFTETVPPILDGCGASDVPLFTLSFDGPGPWVDGILDYLMSQNVKATFFVQPGAVIDRPDNYDNIPVNDPDFDQDGYPKEQPPSGQMCRLVKRVINEGHALGDHSYTHPRYAHAPPARPSLLPLFCARSPS